MLMMGVRMWQAHTTRNSKTLKTSTKTLGLGLAVRICRVINLFGSAMERFQCPR
jgi:hypothetical protein